MANMKQPNDSLSDRDATFPRPSWKSPVMA